MDPYQAEPAALQQQVPIGARHGLAMLHATAGDVAQAAARIRHELTEVIARKAGVPAAEARQALAQHEFHVGCTLDHLYQQRYTLTERLLRRYQQPAEAVSRVAWAVGEAYQVPRKWWFWDLGAAGHLPAVPRCVLTVGGWLDYEACEPLDAAVHFHLDAVLGYLREPLGLPQVVQTLRRLRRLVNGRRRTRSGMRRPQPAYDAAAAVFETQRSQLVEALYQLIVANPALLP